MITLRPYQQAAVDGIYHWFETSKCNPLVVVPTGGGKSLIIAAFVKSVLDQWPKERILVLTHVKELIAQNEQQMLRWWPEAPTGVYSAGLRRRELDQPVTFAGIQSVYNKAKQIEWADLVIVDECHLIPRDGDGRYQQLLNDLGAINSNLKVIGLTATPYRTGEGRLDDGKGRMFAGIAYNCDLAGLILDGYLSRIRSKAAKAQIDTSELHIRGGEFIESEMQAAAMLDGGVQRQCQEIVSRSTGRRSWLVFCCGIDHANAVAEELRTVHGKRVATVFGHTPREERDSMLVAYKAGEIDAVANCNVLTTGFDAPQTDLIALLRPTMSPVLYVQMVGRGLRRAEGKDDCLVLDFGGNFERHGPIDSINVRAPGAGGPAPTKVCPECDEVVLAGVAECPACGYEFPPPDPEPKTFGAPDESAEFVAGLAPKVAPIQTWDVQRIDYQKWQSRSPGKLPTLRVDYACGLARSVSEWVCVEHPAGSFPRKKAIEWWRRRFGHRLGAGESVPESADQAEVILSLGSTAEHLREPQRVVVDVRGEYPQLLQVIFGREPGDSDGAGEPPPTSTSDVDYSDLPF